MLWPEHSSDAPNHEDKSNCFDIVNPIHSAPTLRRHDVPLVPVNGTRAYLDEPFARHVRRTGAGLIRSGARGGRPRRDLLCKKPSVALQLLEGALLDDRCGTPPRPAHPEAGQGRVVCTTGDHSASRAVAAASSSG